MAAATLKTFCLERQGRTVNKRVDGGGRRRQPGMSDLGSTVNKRTDDMVCRKKALPARRRTVNKRVDGVLAWCGFRWNRQRRQEFRQASPRNGGLPRIACSASQTDDK
jgi:hypothetical protein